MPETTTATTELASQYIAQVSGDLEANVKEQERISAEIASLQEQLASLQHDHGVLVSMQQALGITQAAVASGAESTSATVPAPRRKKAGAAAGGQRKTRKSTAGPAKKTARKPVAKKTTTAKTTTAKTAKTGSATTGTAKAGTAKVAEPTLVELIRRHLAEQKEPRSAAEISTALGQAHPERGVSAKVVRVTLEGLVAKSQAERSKQGRSVFYSAPADQAAATPGTEAPSEGTDD
ncbi:gamma-butyrolactone-binding regulator SlbR [Streptomyces levis]|uniref:Gamma-butyrolactone-binding regulator SlbR n=1 Tax=Streptomyces levis TaxID=285566 RepID=A0ABP6AFU5_9ACTN